VGFALSKEPTPASSPGSRLGSHQCQILGYTRPQSASISAAKRHVRAHLASSGDGSGVPSKQPVAGSNPARRANRPGQSHVPILKDRAGSHRNSFSAVAAIPPHGERKPDSQRCQRHDGPVITARRAAVRRGNQRFRADQLGRADPDVRRGLAGPVHPPARQWALPVGWAWLSR